MHCLKVDNIILLVLFWWNCCMLQGNVRVCNHHNESCAAGQVLLCAMAFGARELAHTAMLQCTLAY